MSNTVVKMYPKNAADNPDNVLEMALGNYVDVLVLGYDENGDLIAQCSSGLVDGGELLWLLEQFKRSLLAGEFDAGDE